VLAHLQTRGNQPWVRHSKAAKAELRSGTRAAERSVDAGPFRGNPSWGRAQGAAVGSKYVAGAPCLASTVQAASCKARGGACRPVALLHDQVPRHITSALTDWLRDFERADQDDCPPLMTRVCLRLGFAPGPYPDLASLPYREHDVLELIDAALQPCGSAATAYGEIDDYPEDSNSQLQRDLLQRLDNTLRHGRVAYRVARSGNQLEHRVDPTVKAAAEHAAAISTPTASELLAAAWEQAYALEPNPKVVHRARLAIVASP
jgi:hypothetical protein